MVSRKFFSLYFYLFEGEAGGLQKSVSFSWWNYTYFQQLGLKLGD